MDERKIIGWYTRNGKHIPIFEDSVKSGRENQPISQKYRSGKFFNMANSTVKADKAQKIASENPTRGTKSAATRAENAKKKATAEYESAKNRKTLIKSKFQLNEDVKARQIAQNKEQADKLNSLRTKLVKANKSYKRYGNVTDAADAFTRNTGITVMFNPMSINEYNDNTLYSVFDTIQELQDKYNINKVPADRFEFEVGSRRVRLILYGQKEFEKRVEGYKGKLSDGSLDNLDDSLAFCTLTANRNDVLLNPKFFSLYPSELNEIYGEGVKTLFHPKGTTGKDVVTHEMGHILLHQWCKRLFEQQKNSKFYTATEESKLWKDANNFLTSQTVYTDVNNIDNLVIQQMSEICNKCLRAVKDNDFKYYYGSKANDVNIFEFANPYSNMMGAEYSLSEYAAKNYHELVAEAFSDFNANGKNCKPLSALLIKELFGFTAK